MYSDESWTIIYPKPNSWACGIVLLQMFWCRCTPRDMEDLTKRAREKGLKNKELCIGKLIVRTAFGCIESHIIAVIALECTRLPNLPIEELILQGTQLLMRTNGNDHARGVI